MPATVRGRSGLKRFMAELPAELARKVLRGAARTGARVVSDEIKVRTTSEAVRDGLRTRITADDGRIVVRIDLKPGWARSVGTWLEYGTSAHFISVDDSQRQGMSIGKINEAHKKGSLVIGGRFVGTTVLHPGARPHPAFRPAIDIKGSAAVAAAQGYINSRVRKTGIVGGGDGEGSGE